MNFLQGHEPKAAHITSSHISLAHTQLDDYTQL